jgi:hypothetical protein
MPLYFFHLKDGIDTLIDEEGVPLADPETARASALAQARGIISHDALAGRINLAQHLDVLDEDGRLVCSLKFADAVAIENHEPPMASGQGRDP